MTTSTDRIEKTILLRAPRARVWRALANAEEFGSWFGARFEGAFAAGSPARGTITTAGYEGFVLEITVERIEPERLFSYRWHPYAIDPGVDYSEEPMTLVEFRLEDAPEGTRLTVTDSGFDRIPLSRRSEAFRMNEQGWTSQLKNIERHVSA
jgi:uncharacterized protein YndB with AHSA1/START domain